MGEIAMQTIGDYIDKVNKGETTDKRIERIIGDSTILSYIKYKRQKNVQNSTREA